MNVDDVNSARCKTKLTVHFVWQQFRNLNIFVKVDNENKEGYDQWKRWT